MLEDTDLRDFHDIERLHRSIAMLQPRAEALNREEAIKVLEAPQRQMGREDLDRAIQQLRQASGQLGGRSQPRASLLMSLCLAIIRPVPTDRRRSRVLVTPALKNGSYSGQRGAADG